MKLRTFSLTMLLAVLVPGIAFAVFMVTSAGRLQRQTIERGYLDTTRALSLALDRELLSTISTLQAIGESDHLDDGDLENFRRIAERVLRGQGAWRNVILFDPTGRQLMNLALPPGAVLPGADALAERDAFTRTVAGKQPVISKLFVGNVTHRSIVAVNVPVVRDARVRFVVSATIEPARFTEILTAQHLAPGLLAALDDSDGVILARTRLAEQFVGRRATPRMLAAIQEKTEGWFRNVGLEGQEIYTAYNRSALSGWTVVLVVPAAIVESDLRRSLWTMVGGGCLLLAVTAAVGVAGGRKITQPITAAARAAEALGRGDALPPLHDTRIDELSALHAAFTRSAAVLDERTAARDRAEGEVHTALARAHTLREEAEATNRAKDEFLAMLGHELRNPLGAIRSAVSVLDAIGKQEESAMRARDVVRRQVVHLTTLVDDLLDVARVSSGKISLARQPVDLAEAVTRCVGTLRTSRRVDDHVIRLELASVWVNADETRIDQVITNLVDNAVKYTPRGGSITVTCARDGDAAVLEVADTGSGIPASLLPRVFDLFVQGPRTTDRAPGGLGIGLTLVRQLVELHGGRVQARSEGTGRGSVFTVRLPALAGAPVKTPAPAIAAAPAARRVVVAEDDDDSRAMLTFWLEDLGHEVHGAGDGEAAVELVLRLQPDVALIDIGLPSMDGHEVARRIRAAASGRPVRLVALTGYGQPDDRRRALEAGFDEHLVKPVDPDALTRTLQARPATAANGDERLVAATALTRLIAAGGGMSKVCDAIAEAAVTMLGASVARVWVNDPRAQRLSACGTFGVAPETTRALIESPELAHGHGIPGHIVRTNVPEYLADASQDARWVNRRFITEIGVRGYAGLPLVAGDRVCGVLSVMFTETRVFSEHDKTTLELLAAHAAVALQNAQPSDGRA